MHNDVATSGGDWESYLRSLRERGAFDGGSSIGAGAAFRKSGGAEITETLGGYIRVRAESLEAARECLNGNPVYEAGGTVEIRELPRN
ncbi:MAG TPA: YciI family protein [Rhizomicrobium sp.]